MGKPIAKLLGIDPPKPEDPRIAEERGERDAARAEEAQRLSSLRRKGRRSTILTSPTGEATTSLLGR